MVGRVKLFMKPKIRKKPTSMEKQWLQEAVGPGIWKELCLKPEFDSALKTSMSQARRIALHFIAEKEQTQWAGSYE
jgi:hypothetical protein